MATAVKRTISLPPELADEIDEVAKLEGKSVSAVVQEAIRLARAERLKGQFKEVQGFWSQRAREKGILTEDDLERLLAE